MNWGSFVKWDGWGSVEDWRGDWTSVEPDEFPFSVGYCMRRLAAWAGALRLISSC